MLPSRTRISRFISLSVLLLCGPFMRGQAHPVAPVSVETLGNGAIPLAGPWQFHAGDEARWAESGFDDGQWEQISADKPWGAQTHENYTGSAWYRLHLVIDVAPGASPGVALYIPPIQDAYEIYWNGQLVGRNGNLPPSPVWYWKPPPHTFGLGTVHSGVLAVRVWKSPLDSFDAGTLGGFTGTPILGSPQAIGVLKDSSDFRWLRSHQVLFGLDSLYALVALLGLLGWIRDRSQRLVFWMACFAGSVVILDFLERLGVPFRYNVAEGVAQPFFGLVNVATCYVLIVLLDLGSSRRLMRAVRIVVSIEMIAFTLDGILALSVAWLPSGWSVNAQWADAVLTAIFTMMQTVTLFVVVYAVARRRRLNIDRWIVAVCAFLADGIPTLRSALSQGTRFTHWTIADKLSAPLFVVRGNPINAQAIGQTMLLLAIVYAVYRYTADERRRQNAIEQEMRNARELQQVLIPEAIPEIPGFTLTSAYRPAQEVGGDFFQIIPLQSGEKGYEGTLIVLGDVSGKGLRAAMAVSLIVGATRMAAEKTSNPAEVLAALSRRLHGRLAGGFATAIAMRVETNGHCTVATAGHPSPFLNDTELNLHGALPLGLSASMIYQETSFSLRPGDHLALYTDGLLEARKGSGELYGFARLKSLFATGCNATQAAEAAVAFGQDDDITVITLTRLQPQEFASAMSPASSLAPSPA